MTFFKINEILFYITNKFFFYVIYTKGKRITIKRAYKIERITNNRLYTQNTNNINKNKQINTSNISYNEFSSNASLAIKNNQINIVSFKGVNKLKETQGRTLAKYKQYAQP